MDAFLQCEQLASLLLACGATLEMMVEDGLLIRRQLVIEVR